MPPDGPNAPVPDSMEEHIEPTPGAHAHTRERYVDLYELVQRLGRLARWDRAAPLLALGTLLLGAGVGGWVAKEKLVGDTLLAVVAGAALLVGGLALRDQKRQDIRSLYQDIQGRLCVYDEDPRVQAIQAKYAQREREAFEKSWRGLLVRGVRMCFGYMQRRRTQKANNT